MKFDRMGRRVSYLETVSGGSFATVTNGNYNFVYEITAAQAGRAQLALQAERTERSDEAPREPRYLCIQRIHGATKNVKLIFTWDPLEKVATRLLMVAKTSNYRMYVTHDGNKNVSELVFFGGLSGIAAHYEYAPFGAVTVSTKNTSVYGYDFRTYNPFRFSSEYADDALGLVYYNYRHYNPLDGRWTSRDPLEEVGGTGVYMFIGNRIGIDCMGLAKVSLTYETSENGKKTMSEIMDELRQKFEKYSPGGVDPCNCLSCLRLIGHGSEGYISLGDHTIGQMWIDMYMKRKREGKDDKYQAEPTEALDMLSLAASFACDEFTVEFVTCYSGKGESGYYLNEALQKLLGSRTHIILYDKEVAMFLGFVIKKPEWRSWLDSLLGDSKKKVKVK